MNIPMSWLKEYANVNCTMQEFIHEMTMSGSKVETVVSLCKELQGIVTGKILEITKHEQADKLLVTKIDIGGDKPLQIVTGASNIFEGAIVPVATHGSVVAGGQKIKTGKLRGVESQGMLCSIEELGYTVQDYPEAPEHGIYIFKDEQPLGADVREVLQLCDDVVEFEITSNRADCFSVVGIAREAAATFRVPFNPPEIAVKEEAKGNVNDMIAIDIKNPELCPRYAARAVKNVKIQPSPLWLRHRLIAAGLRPINNIVDITNYVMLELGQPMHAFDIDNIANRQIVVRNAEEGEVFTTLDGVERKLDKSMLVIADPEKAVAIAGVMGGENSKITENATAILFESATFNGPNIRNTSKKLGLRTDSSGKFEKGLDPNLAYTAVNRAAQLVELLGCGEVVAGIADCYPNKLEPWKVKYSPASINALLGIDITDKEMSNYLAMVGITTKNNVATIPTNRTDIQMEADLAEEVVRFYGYDKIPFGLPDQTATMGKKTNSQIMEDTIKNTMVSLGYCEAMTYSFESPKVFDKLQLEDGHTLRSAVKVSNPLGEDFSVMRTSMLNAMLTSLSNNYNRRNEDVALFEMSKIFLPKELPLKELPVEPLILCVGQYGKSDFFDLKGVIEQLFDRLDIKDLDFSPETTINYMHPGRCAVISVNGKQIGFMGEVHPAVLSAYEIGTKALVAHINVSDLQENISPGRQYIPLPRYPGIKRDIAITVKDSVTHKEITGTISASVKANLESIELFDVYKGSQIEEGYKSMAYKIFFRNPQRTLTEDEINGTMQTVLDNLADKCGAVLRDK